MAAAAAAALEAAAEAGDDAQVALPLSLPELIVAAYGVERGSFDAEVPL